MDDPFPHPPFGHLLPQEKENLYHLRRRTVERRYPGLAGESGGGKRGLDLGRRCFGLRARFKPPEHTGTGTGNTRAHRTRVQRRLLG